VLPILDELGSVIRIGSNGQGLLMRLAIDAAVAAQMVSFSEAMLLAERAGVDRSLAVRAVIQSSAGSLLLKTHGPFVLGLPKNTSLDVGRLHDGLELALETAGTLEVPLPTTAIARELFATARAMGYEDQDIAVVYEVLAEIVNSP
jgi:3-hydroxyisobutyrate dehydrogenase-like beta-hydroxyacid dehydrogenase